LRVGRNTTGVVVAESSTAPEGMTRGPVSTAIPVGGTSTASSASEEVNVIWFFLSEKDQIDGADDHEIREHGGFAIASRCKILCSNNIDDRLLAGGPTG
jgi:hypothetical protein